MNRRQHLVSRPLVALAMVMAMTAGVASAQTNVKPGFNLFSPQQDVEIGQQSAEQAAAAVEFALEGLYLTRRLAKDIDGTRTVYGS